MLMLMGTQLLDVHRAYLAARQQLIDDPEPLVQAESWATSTVSSLIQHMKTQIKDDYDAASWLYPFWRNYPPDARGRMPVGDQFPWIEVGEHTVGSKLVKALSFRHKVRDIGFPSGPDQRLLLIHEAIPIAGFGALWVMLDVKSAGPRDDFPNVVMSHNQISGDGLWSRPDEGLRNTPMVAKGDRSQHDFHPSLPPLIILPDMLAAPVITLAVKPVYSMPGGQGGSWGGQPLRRVDLVCIPNGLLLCVNPNLLGTYPGLLFPGKDDKGKNALKRRARVSKQVLRAVDGWRWTTAAAYDSGRAV